MAGEIKKYFEAPAVQAKLKELLKDKAGQFTTSVLSLVGNDELLANAQPASLFSAALTAASLDLPINKNLGFAHIIGYKNNRKGGVVEAQFQIGWKGFVQLAQRTGQYKTISATEVYEGQLTKEDRLRGNVYDWEAKTSDTVVGYVSLLVLTTGFEHELYMSVDDIKAHAKKYSQSYKSGYGPWVDNFDAMALKTVIKLNISKFGPQSTELQKALKVDQAIVEGDTVDYADGTDVDLEDVGADDDKKAAIIAANIKAEVISEEPLSSDEMDAVKEAFPGVEIKETVKEKAARKYGPKQSTLVPEEPKDDNRTRNNPGQ